MSRLFEYTGLGAALVGALSMVHGEWDEVFGCPTLVIVSAFLAGLWEPTEYGQQAA
jgi:hypothetical protein